MTKTEFAYGKLRDSIIDGSRRPGDRIVIHNVAEEFGMSPIPIREAITQLAKEGLLSIRPHAGAVVSDIPLHGIEEIFALLESLEITAVRLALPHFDEKGIAALEQVCDQMESARDLSRWAELNRQFHEMIPEMAGLSRVSEFLGRVGEDWERLRKLRFSENQPKDLSAANSQHREFVRLLGDKKIAPVEKWIRDHNREALKRYRNAIGPVQSLPGARV